MKFPPHLSLGDKVVIVSPAGRIESAVVERGASMLRQRGYEVVLGAHVCGGHGIYSGTDAERAADMQAALDDPSVKAVFFSRGGYGSIRTHELLDWNTFFENPKWLVGFSDITVFHSFLTRHGIASMHGVMCSMFADHDGPTESFLSMMDWLEAGTMHHTLPAHEMNKKGCATGILAGGNLSVIQSLRGTPMDIDPEGKILFIEDINEQLYHIDRMMRNLKAGGILEPLSGLIVGHFTDMKDGAFAYGKTANEIIREAVDSFAYPVVFGFPCGHELPNMPLKMGGGYKLDVSDIGTRLVQAG